MNKLIASVAILSLGSLFSTPISAQEPNEGQNTVLSSFDDWQQNFGSEWRLRRHNDLPTAQFLWGYHSAAPFLPQTDGDFEELARIAFDDAYDMFGIDDFSLKLINVKHLDLQQIATTDKVAVEFAQRVNGIDVVGGSAQALFTPQGELLALDGLALPHLRTFNARPQNDRFVAVSAAMNEYQKLEGGREPNSVSSPELVIVKHKQDKFLQPRLAWSIELRNNEDSTSPAGRKIFIAADGGYAMLEQRNLIHNQQASGTVESNATPGTSAHGSGNLPTLHNMPYMYVTSGGSTYTTDINGNVTIPAAGNVSASYNGIYCRVYNQAGSDHVASTNFVAGSGNVLTMNTAKTEFITAEASSYDSVNDFKIWLESIDPNDATMDFQVTTNVNLNSTCNAYYDGVSINMYSAGGGCSNTGFSTVVAHEEGHWANTRYNSGNGSDGFGEGNADVFAMYIYDTPIVGEGFFTTGGYIRNGTNNRQYCGDTNGGCYGQVHTDGEVLMGALWKVRERLDATLGNTAGDFTADTLFIAWMNAYNDSTINSIIEEHWLVLDDDNGNIGDGTPNYADIDGGFRQQGFPGVDLDIIQILHTELGNSLSEAGPYVVNADITSLVGSSVTAAEVTFTVNDGAPTTINMNNPIGADWTVGIPGQISPARVEYYITAHDAAGNNEDLPSNSAFSFVVGVESQIYFNDFEGAGDEGWTHAQVATQDDWQRGTPAGKAEDPSAAYSGAQSWGNDIGAAGWNGLYATNVNNYLQSPAIDCSGATGVTLRFARSLAVEEGLYDNAKIKVNGITVWENPLSGHLIDANWNMQEVDISAIADNNPSVNVRFTLESDGGLEFGGWNIDDFEVMTLGPVPGGGSNVLTLAGDTVGQRGSSVSYSIGNMQPGSNFAVLASLSNSGSVILGNAFDIGSPYSIVAQGVADLSGNGSVTFIVPMRLSAGAIGYIEAGAQSALGVDDSNMLTILIL
ncbi:MAG: hypothetical protein ACI84O_001489 [Myxococcota bacterium]|jgi:hypothetical protein